ncbi:ribosome-associated translation inhibitor RaiA [Proteinivorax hydrogeniformans]|uniref:Ribosome hibernation promoting factor n=1 Tax=Proteinivorax hydrogeniformans TaxID=1826727 RepID=A0AAU8HV21_9FIRM
MKIKVRGQNIEVTNALKLHVEKRIGKLERYFQENTEAQVTLTVIKDQHIIEVTVFLNGGLLLRAEEKTGDMYASIDQVVEKLERQTRKYKTRVNRKSREVSIKDINGSLSPKQEQEDEYPQIVKTKRFALKPMMVDEAVLQMDLLGHDFFVFKDGETNETCVVYKRNDGNYGLIEPEIL